MRSALETITNFILESKEDLIQDPIRGKLCVIHNLFNKYNEKKGTGSSYTFQAFIKLLLKLCDISGSALEFDIDLQEYKWNETISSINEPSLKWINWQRLVILKERLSSLQIKESKFKEKLHMDQFKSKYEFLISLLGPLQTTIKEERPIDYDSNLVVDIDLPMLDNLLVKPIALISLAQEKVRLKTKIKPYYEICDDPQHCHILSNVCLKRDLLKLGLPELLYTHKIIQQAHNVIPSETLKCSQTKIHYLPILNNHTDLYLGDCSYLDTCHKMKTCRYLHYYSLFPITAKQDELEQDNTKRSSNHEYTVGECYTECQRKQMPAQWINCDVRYLPFLILGKFAVILSDPAWDIHMSLPYGTCKDFELLSLPMHELQDEGLILLWVTGRAIEVGRQALQNWGYSIADEMIWIKLNQLKRTIVTGRTGHWLNHSKEHLLVGIKGDPPWINRLMDIDVIVSGTRETLRKPDEVYDIVERIVGTHSRKLEIFGRDHNVRPGWLSMYRFQQALNRDTNIFQAIGNQLQGTSIYEKEVSLKYDQYLKNLNVKKSNKFITSRNIKD
mmetsp:Transcript_4405/g.5188  ORF Transcript_4405/g.5188 Transcript_4405/m.5188 type:complete len:559 (-) Transcript_4405:3074-4750(-)